MNVKRTSYLELFFDLVFVFAITQLTGMLHAEHTLAGWGRAALMAWLVWWAWSQFTWAGNAIDLERQSTRAAILLVAGLMLGAAVAVPGAFDALGAWFAIPYAAVRIGGMGLYWIGLRSDPAYRAALGTYLPVAAIGPVLILAGGLGPEAARPWIWTSAVVIDIASALAAGRGEFRVAPEHFAERHALFVIIALGESVIAVGAAAADLELTRALAWTAASAFAIVATMWWSYFDRVHDRAELRLVHEPDHRRRGRLARDLFTFAHFPIVAGPVAIAAGIEEAILHPAEPLDAFARAAVAVGLALFGTGCIVAVARAGRGLLVERLTGTVVVVLLAVLATDVRAPVLLGVIALVLGATTAIEGARRDRLAPAE